MIARQYADMPKRPENPSSTDTIIKTGQRLRAIREIGNIKQEDLCARLGVDQSTYSKWEKGKRLPDVLVLTQFAARFMVSLDFLYRGIPSRIHPDVLALMREKHPDLVDEPPTDKEPDMDKALSSYRAAIAAAVSD